AGIVDIGRWAAEVAGADAPAVPCAQPYEPHARATRAGGHRCLVLSPNQEIKLFAGGAQAFAFAHGRWRILDAAAKFAVWRGAVAGPRLIPGGPEPGRVPARGAVRRRGRPGGGLRPADRPARPARVGASRRAAAGPGPARPPGQAGPALPGPRPVRHRAGP